MSCGRKKGPGEAHWVGSPRAPYSGLNLQPLPPSTQAPSVGRARPVPCPDLRGGPALSVPSQLCSKSPPTSSDPAGRCGRGNLTGLAFPVPEAGEIPIPSGPCPCPASPHEGPPQALLVSPARPGPLGRLWPGPALRPHPANSETSAPTLRGPDSPARTGQWRCFRWPADAPALRATNNSQNSAPRPLLPQVYSLPAGAWGPAAARRAFSCVRD